MLPKSQRFSTQDLKNIKNQKFRKINTNIGFFVVYESSTPPSLPLQRGGIAQAKKGILVSKKVFKTAVSRNKHKRLFYNTVKELDNLKDKSFIFHPKKVFNKEELLNFLSVLQ